MHQVKKDIQRNLRVKKYIFDDKHLTPHSDSDIFFGLPAPYLGSIVTYWLSVIICDSSAVDDELQNYGSKKCVCGRTG
jgi:hypothetical protein